jgi:MYXO-CTERM domain-containing protein
MLTAVCALTLAPALASACGGMFCDNAQPVTQTAERILFAREGARMHMIVQITYQGPPTEFGWLLPAPGDVETAVSSAQLFATLDARFRPTFQLETVLAADCGQPPAPDGGPLGGWSDDSSGAGGGGGEAPVVVLSREPIGPYDRAILRAGSVEALIGWLDENAYQVPEGAEARLQPYVDLGLAFVAIKLLPGQGSRDIVPLQLTFTSDSPAIPLRPTAVAAEPDTGVIVHLLGKARAVPTNFAHLQLNEAAIDWRGRGGNYADVVSQAADEAGGHGFVTDFAGRFEWVDLRTFSDDTLGAVEQADTFNALQRAIPIDISDSDLLRVLQSSLVSEEIPVGQLIGCPDCYGGLEVDGPALAARLEAEYNAPRREVNRLVAANPYLTRLFTTMSPAEMDRDPIFAFNPDLEPVSNVHQATQHVGCAPEGGYDFANAVIELSNGQRVIEQRGEVIVRQGGETIRGLGVRAAALVEQQHATGQPEPILDHRAQLTHHYTAGLNTGSEGGCDCDTTGDAPGPMILLLGLGVLALRRR